MPTLAKRAVGALLALLGLVLTVIGLWYAVHLGGSGTATFSATSSGTNPVLVPQTVLNRVDGKVKVTATPRKGGSVWLAAASPSDAKAVLGQGAHTTVTGVSTMPWELRTTTAGTGQTPALDRSDVWRNTDAGDGPVSMTVEQANAPETVIVQATKGQLARIDLTWERKSWFVQSVVAALVGLFLLLSGLTLLWSSRLAGRPERALPAGDEIRPPAVAHTSDSPAVAHDATPATGGAHEAPAPTGETAAVPTHHQPAQHQPAQHQPAQHQPAHDEETS